MSGTVASGPAGTWPVLGGPVAPGVAVWVGCPSELGAARARVGSTGGLKGGARMGRVFSTKPKPSLVLDDDPQPDNPNVAAIRQISGALPLIQNRKPARIPLLYAIQVLARCVGMPFNGLGLIHLVWLQYAYWPSRPTLSSPESALCLRCPHLPHVR
jgi:hypothetical protein